MWRHENVVAGAGTVLGVCYAIGSSAWLCWTRRTTNDAAKIMLIFWCLFAFIGTGFEHSVVNQSFLGMALFLSMGTQ